MAQGTNSSYKTLLYEAEEDDDPMLYFYSTLLARTNEEKSNRPKRRHASVQTDPEVEEVYVPWLKEIEKKTEEFCVELNNLLNSFYNSFLEETKRPVSDPNRALREELQRLRERFQRDSKNKIGHTDHATAASSNRAVTNSRAKNMFTDMEGKLKSLLRRAETVRNSIPVINADTAVNIETKMAKFVENTQMLSQAPMVSSSSPNLKRATSKTQRSKTEPFMACLEPEKNGRCRFKSQKQPTGPTRTVVGGRIERPKNFTGERTSPPANMPEEKSQQEQQRKLLTGFDREKNQGAIPKRPINRNVATTKKTGESSRNTNSKKYIAQKPMWR